MSKYYGADRTNYFKVKDLEKFKEEWGTVLGDVTIEESDDGKEVALLFDEYGLPCQRENGEEIESIIVVDLIAPHLEDGQVCIIMEAGSHKLCFINGWACCFNNKGDYKDLFLDDIYQYADSFSDGVDVSRCEH